MSTSKFLVVYFSAITFTLFLGFVQSIYLTSIGVPWFVCAVISFILGATLPSRLVAWILKEELEKLLTEQPEGKE